jgi:hypothetical protein
MSEVTMSTSPLDLAAGLAVGGIRVGIRVGRTLLVPARLTARSPVIGARLHQRAVDVGIDGQVQLARGRAALEAAVATVLAAPEVERTMDRALAGPLTEALARSLAEHRVAERLAGELVANGALEEAMTSALEHDEARRLVERAIASPGLERLITTVLESKLVPELTDRILASNEMQAVLEYVAKSPEIRRALTEQSSSLAEEMVDGLRTRTEGLDTTAESAIRGWLRRPRPSSA